MVETANVVYLSFFVSEMFQIRNGYFGGTIQV